MHDMKEFIYKACAVPALAIIVVSMLLSPGLASAQTTTGSCQTLNNQFQQIDTPSGSTTTVPTGQGGLTSEFPSYCTAGQAITTALNILFSLSGVAAVFFIVLGGFIYMSSAGNQEQADKGKNTLMYAIIGLAVVVLAATIVNLVFNLLYKGG
jgi:hypothetical protein